MENKVQNAFCGVDRVDVNRNENFFPTFTLSKGRNIDSVRKVHGGIAFLRKLKIEKLFFRSISDGQNLFESFEQFAGLQTF